MRYNENIEDACVPVLAQQCVFFSLKTKRSAPNAQQMESAEGVTDPTVVVLRRGNVAVIDTEVSSWGRPRTNTGRPVIAALASVPQETETDIDVPAAHDIGPEIEKSQPLTVGRKTGVYSKILQP